MSIDLMVRRTEGQEDDDDKLSNLFIFVFWQSIVCIIFGYNEIK